MDRALDVEIEDLSKYFGSFCAVDKMNFNVKHGEVFGLLGPNGAGKSTLIRMLTTLVTPSSGHARVNGFDVVQNPNGVRQSIGVIPQAMTSDLDLTAWENMTIFAKLYGLSPQKRKTAIHDLLGAVNLLDWADKPVKTFSGGMRRRLEIARGLVHEPRIFILDEPTRGIDVGAKAEILSLIRELAGQGLGVLMISSELEEVVEAASRIFVLRDGYTAAELKGEALSEQSVMAAMAHGHESDPESAHG